MQKIIHVDNSAFFRKVMKIFISEQGYAIEGFSRGSEALEQLHSGDVCLLITGLSLADMKGEELIQKIITSPCSSVPIITLTSTESDTQLQKLRLLGVKATILKSEPWREQLLPYLQEYVLYQRENL
ncbi:MAG: response regulator [Treponema sp.]|jgi:CheY-like chemotaxis protein|nr:response regulator [Treponema sp.]